MMTGWRDEGLEDEAWKQKDDVIPPAFALPGLWLDWHVCVGAERSGACLASVDTK